MMHLFGSYTFQVITYLISFPGKVDHDASLLSATLKDMQSKLSPIAGAVNAETTRNKEAIAHKDFLINIAKKPSFEKLGYWKNYLGPYNP
jgi:hypothetical protein